jgi:GalNAc-alpha-(1->4)-GalNAc-alpha-(1->3)-diNAcBac-PP-undecaprenol alpha-1,4-N-acetyl-D-galactosaminyltransferase
LKNQKNNREKNVICFLIPSLQAGGMERVMTELLWHFSRKNDLAITLILYGKEPELFYHIPSNINLIKPDFIFREKFRAYYTFKTLLFLRKEVKKIKPSSVLSFGEYWNSFVLLALLWLKTSVYISDRCNPDKKFGFFHSSLRKLLYPTAKGIIAQTSYAKEVYRRKFKNKNIRIIGNPIRTINANENGQRDKIVLSIGRLITTKNHDLLLRIFSRVRKPGWELVIIGYDHLKQKNMEKLVLLSKELGIEDHVHITGKISDVDSFYSKSSIFAFTSSSEGFPNVIGEAMSAGLPVITFNCVAGPKEMITDNKDGFLIPMFDVEQYCKKLSALIDDSSLREAMGSRAKEAIKKYSIDIVGDEYYNFISEV